MINLDKCVSGIKLSVSDQKKVLASFTYRFTGEHKPERSIQRMSNGDAYPVQFKDDNEWLENTVFQVKNNGSLDDRVKTCHSSPTWPYNPELRKIPL